MKAWISRTRFACPSWCPSRRDQVEAELDAAHRPRRHGWRRVRVIVSGLPDPEPLAGNGRRPGAGCRRRVLAPARRIDRRDQPSIVGPSRGMIGGQAAAPGSQGGRPSGSASSGPTRPTSATAGPDQLVAREAASRPRSAFGRALARARRRPVRASPLQLRGDRGAAAEEEGAGDLQLRPDQLVRLRDRGDPAGPGPRRRRRAAPEPAHRGRDRPAARGRLHELPPDRLRLSVGRRRLRRRAGEPADPRRARGGRRAARRLRHDGGGVDGVGRRADRLGGPGALRRPRSSLASPPSS